MFDVPVVDRYNFSEVTKRILDYMCQVTSFLIGKLAVNILMNYVMSVGTDTYHDSIQVGNSGL